MKIKIQLKDLMRSDTAIEKLGLNPWCLNEGGDGEEFIEVEVNSLDFSNIKQPKSHIIQELGFDERLNMPMTEEEFQKELNDI